MSLPWPTKSTVAFRPRGCTWKWTWNNPKISKSQILDMLYIFGNLRSSVKSLYQKNLLLFVLFAQSKFLTFYIWYIFGILRSRVSGLYWNFFDPRLFEVVRGHFSIWRKPLCMICFWKPETKWKLNLMKFDLII